MNRFIRVFTFDTPRHKQYSPPREPEVDPAALAAAAVAAVLPGLIEKGPYDRMSFALGFTLLSVIFGYQWNANRRRAQSIGFAAVCGFCSISMVGAIIQQIWGKGEPEDIVKAKGSFMIWLISLVITYLVDRWFIIKRFDEVHEPQRR